MTNSLNGTAPKRKKIDANDYAAEHGPGALKIELNRLLDIEKARAAALKAAEPPQPHDGPPTCDPAQALDSGACSHWPEIVDAVTALRTPAPRPEELIQGVAFVGSKISLSSTSKGHKTYLQIDMAHSVATGAAWMEHPVKQGRVLYVNLELLPYSFESRLAAIIRKKGVAPDPGMLDILHLRGLSVTIEDLQQHLRAKISGKQYALIIVDPLYKLLGDRSENDASQMGDLLNRLEAIAHHAGAGIVVAHHYAKGSAAGKSQMDRAAGSGVVARDGDAILTFTEHEEPDCVTFEMTLRDFPPVPASVLRWVYPTFEPMAELDPCKLKKSPTQAAPITQADILSEVSESLPLQRHEIIEKVMKKTSRGEKAVRDAFNKTVHLLKSERLKRSGTKDLVRFTIK